MAKKETKTKATKPKNAQAKPSETTKATPPQSRRAEGKGQRDEKGRFLKGTSGNPGGMTKEQAKTIAQIKELAASKSEAAVEALYQIATRGKDERARVQAAVAILDRAFGKPRQELEVSSPPDGAVTVKAEVKGPPVQGDQLADVLAVLASAGVTLGQAREEEASEE